MSKKHVYELKRARKLIEYDHSYFVCNALKNQIRYAREVEDICKQISLDLGGCIH